MFRMTSVNKYQLKVPEPEGLTMLMALNSIKMICWFVFSPKINVNNLSVNAVH